MTFDILVGPLGALLIGYLLGSIPFGILLTRATGAGDLRAIGSGNIGATNVLRTGRKGLAALTLLLDAAKGAAAILVVRLVFPGEPQLEPLAAFGALIGHLYPLWLRFRGGKGVATFLGILAALHWPIALAAAAIWLAMLALTRFSSLAGMTMALSAPVLAALLDRFDLALLLLGFALLIVWKHRANLERLMSGSEPRVGRRAAEEASDA
ncbi:MAG: acyl phosphate:glycerol-3-phosphate acyltransferase [Sphingomonadales bacterium]|nr:acyl phosphate:glycerol-3-phosphate acyltransferase [Sphingomonadales bacterium]